MSKKAGYIAIIGRPNVGKSTLINHLLGQKIAITSRKPQTTRHTLLGIHHYQQSQMIFIDTPGIHYDEKKAINRHMNRSAWQALDYVDIVLFITEATQWTEEDEKINQNLQKLNLPTLQLLNKIDKIKDKTSLLHTLLEREQKSKNHTLIPISALKEQNLDALLNAVDPLLPQQEWLFPEEQITTASMRFMASEIIREKIFRSVHQEIPYSVGVLIERYQENEKKIEIFATILVERDSQKAIIIGKGGRTLKHIGQSAREELEKISEKKVILKNFVKTQNNWQNKQQILHSMGHGNL